MPREAVEVFFTEQRFGTTEVLLEEHLEGEELSLLALCDGDNVLPLAPAQDYKRIFDGDEGPNTGGMGSYSPVPGIGADRVEEIADLVHRPIVAAMADRGAPFHGVLYAGLMMTVAGPRVLEYNVRFGDPETQAVLPRLRSDLVDLFLAGREPGGLAGAEARVRRRLGSDRGARLRRIPGVRIQGGRDLGSGRGGGRRRSRDHACGNRSRRAGAHRDRRRPGAWRDRLRPRRGSGARPRVRGGAEDQLRRNADARGHRATRR